LLSFLDTTDAADLFDSARPQDFSRWPNHKMRSLRQDRDIQGRNPRAEDRRFSYALTVLRSSRCRRACQRHA